jgi:Ca2+-binding RTX toxin-like protein
MSPQNHQNRAPQVESLEERRMLSSSISSHGTLDVEGTRRADVVTITKTSRGRIDVSVNGVHETFRGKSVRAIVVNTGRGDDSVAVCNDNQGIGVHRSIDGGAGNDTLVGGKGEDSITGDAGEDRLDGREGNDIVDGGDDNDMVVGGSGDDDLTGDLGDDSINGGDGDDHCNGGDGNDNVNGDIGDDSVLGGRGADHFHPDMDSHRQQKDEDNDDAEDGVDDHGGGPGGGDGGGGGGGADDGPTHEIVTGRKDTDGIFA